MGNGLREYQPKDPSELVDFLEAENVPAELAVFIKKLQPGEKITRNFLYDNPSTVKDITKLQSFLDNLREHGIDVGRGDAKYGFKMPLPNPKDPNYNPHTRELIIFRR